MGSLKRKSQKGKLNTQERLMKPRRWPKPISEYKVREKISFIELTLKSGEDEKEEGVERITFTPDPQDSPEVRPKRKKNILYKTTKGGKGEF